jgi:fibronectin-binding autotransporter adhesin
MKLPIVPARLWTISLLLLVPGTATVRAADRPWHDSDLARSSETDWWLDWINDAPGTFATPAASPIPAASGQNLTVDNGEVYAVTASDTYDYLYDGGDSTGTINHSAGTLTITDTAALGINAGSMGTYNLSGSGTLSIGGTIVIGQSGTGVFNQTGGTLSAPRLDLGEVNGGTGTYNLSGNGQLTAAEQYVGFGSQGTFNQTGGTNSASNFLEIGGNAGSSGYVLSGGTLSTANEYVGYGSTGTFTQNGGSHSVSNALYIGYLDGTTGNTGTGTYTLNSGTLTTPRTNVGYVGTGTFNQTGGTHTINGFLAVGYGGNGTYNFSGGTLTSTASVDIGGYVQVGSTIDSGNGTFNQTAGSIDFSHGLAVGVDGGAGTYNLSGGTLTSLQTGVGFASGQTDLPATGTFNQTAGTFSAGSDLVVGYLEVGAGVADQVQGTFNLSNAAVLTASLGILGEAATGYFNQSGTSQNTTSDLYVGYADGNTEMPSKGTYTLSGGTLTTTQTEIGNGGTGFFYQSGASQNNSSQLYVGTSDSKTATPSTGTYTLSGGTLTTTQTEIGNGGTGSFYQSGTSQHTTSLLYVAYANGNTAMPSTASYLLSGGTLTTGETQIGNAGTGMFEQTGGSQSVTGSGNNQISLGLNGGSGTYVLSNGSLLDSDLAVGYSGNGATVGTGLFVQQGGTVNTDGVELGVNSGSAGTYSLEGGTLTTTIVIGGSGTSTFHFNGGTLQAKENTTGFLTGFTTADVRNFGAIIDTQSYGVTAAQDIVHSTIGTDNATDGGLTKLGTGTLTLSGTNTYTGGTNLNAGTLDVGSAGALGTTGQLSFNGGTLQYSAANQTDYSARFSTAASQAYNIDTNGQNVTFATGLTSSGGTLTKLGAGTLTFSGVNSYTGDTTVSAGTLAITGGSLGVSNSTANFTVDGPAGAAATATLGGSATLNQSYEFIGSAAAGTLTQNGGTNNVGNILFLGYGNGATTGTYNLSAGTLQTNETQVGNGGTGSFNQSGGTHTSNNSVELGLNGGTGTYNLTGGTLSVNGAVDVGYSGTGTGTFNQFSGFVVANTGVNLAQFDSSTGTYNLDGGTLTTPFVAGGTGTSTFNFDAGVLQATENNANFLSGISTVQMRGGMSTIDTQGYNVTINQVLAHSDISGDNATDGGLSKTGPGTLTLTATETYTGNTRIYGGALVVSGALTSPSSTVVENNGATLAGGGIIDGNVFVLAGGTIAPSLGGQLSARALYLNSSLSLASNALLAINLAGPVAGTGYDTIVTGGPLTLGGDLKVTLAATFAPTIGEVFTIVFNEGTQATAGVFANAPLDLYTNAAGDVFLVDYAANSDGSGFIANDVTLTFLSAPFVPEPRTWALVSLGGAGLLGLTLRQRRRSGVRTG